MTDAIQVKISVLENQVIAGEAKIRLLERENRDLVGKLLNQDTQIKQLQQKANDEARRADVFKVENLRQKEIMLEMAREKNIPDLKKRKWHEFWKGQK